MKLSLAIPVYESFGRGREFIEFQFNKFLSQTFKDFEIIISDQSKNEDIKNLCTIYENKLNLKYIKNDIGRGRSSLNLNNAIKNCNGDLIKILFQDDFLWDENSLEKTINNFSKEKHWLISACEHTKDDGKTFYKKFIPYYNEKIYLGNNTISSPSVLTIRNNKEKNIFFDENMIWLMDVDYYKRLYDNFGEPEILNEVTVVNRIWEKQMTNFIPDSIKNNEYKKVVEKFGC